MYNIVQTEINLPVGTVEQLKNLYQLCCGFSAHPAHSKWWDFSEIYESHIEEILRCLWNGRRDRIRSRKL